MHESAGWPTGLVGDLVKVALLQGRISSSRIFFLMDTRPKSLPKREPKNTSKHCTAHNSTKFCMVANGVMGDDW